MRNQFTLATKYLVVAVLSGLPSAQQVNAWETAHAPAGLLGPAELDALIESLANRNTEPIMVGKVPLYPADYNWNEDRRVRALGSVLAKFEGEELWRGMVRHLDDNRYVIALDPNDSPGTYSIAVLCFWRASAELTYPLMKSIAPGPADDLHRRIVRARSEDDLQAWCRDHKDVPLYRQQIEICEIGRERLKAEQKISPERKQAIDDAIRKQIDALTTSKEPQLPEHHFFYPADARYFDEKSAKKTREAYENQKSQ